MGPPPSPSGVLLLDKAEGWSSTQALARAKRALEAAKAGHTGTLDPFATGLLPLVFGEATKFSRFLIDSHKAYVATLRLGAVSTTGDTEGEVVACGGIPEDVGKIDDVLRRFVGPGWQVPPMHSAVHHAGQRLYDLARQGVEVPREPRAITVHALRRERLEGDRLVVSLSCSKGTYVRTLAADIGAALGCGAYLVGLRRTGVGPFGIEAAVTLATLQEEGSGAARGRLLPVEVLVGGLDRADVPDESALRFTQGREIGWERAQAGSEWAVFDPGNRFLGVGRAESPGRIAPLRLMATGAARVP